MKIALIFGYMDYKCHWRVKIHLPSHENKIRLLRPEPDRGNQIIAAQFHIYLFLCLYSCWISSTLSGIRGCGVVGLRGFGVAGLRGCGASGLRGFGVSGWCDCCRLPYFLAPNLTVQPNNLQVSWMFLFGGGAYSMNVCSPASAKPAWCFGCDDVETRRFCGMAMASNKAVGGISIFRDIQWDIMGVVMVNNLWLTYNYIATDSVFL